MLMKKNNLSYFYIFRHNEALDVPIRATVLSAMTILLPMVTIPIANGLFESLQTRAEVLTYIGQLHTMLYCPLIVQVSFASKQSHEAEQRNAADKEARQAIVRSHALRMKQQREAERARRLDAEISATTYF